MNILHLDSSALGADSASRALTAAIVTGLRAAAPAAAVTYRDLAAEPLKPIDGPLLQILRSKAGPAAALPPALRHEVDLTETLLAELLRADTVVIGAPMYNFSIPSTLKTWIDRVLQPGQTFAYTAEGPRGLISGKRVIIASTRGSQLSGQPYEAAMDHQEAYLRTVFGFIGLTDLTFVRAEGLGLSSDARAAAMEAALSQAATLTAVAA